MSTDSRTSNRLPLDEAVLFEGIPEMEFAHTKRYSVNVYNNPFYGHICKVYAGKPSDKHESGAPHGRSILRVRSKPSFFGSTKSLVLEKRSKMPEKKFYKFCEADASRTVNDSVERVILSLTPEEEDPLFTQRVVMFRNTDAGYADTLYKQQKLRWCSVKAKVGRKRQKNIRLVPLLHTETALVDSDNPLQPSGKLIDCHSFFERLFSSTHTPNPLKPSRLSHPLAICQKSTHSTFSVWNLFSSLENHFEIDIKELPDGRSSHDSMVFLCMIIVLKRQLMNQNTIARVKQYKARSQLLHRDLQYRLSHRI